MVEFVSGVGDEPTYLVCLSSLTLDLIKLCDRPILARLYKADCVRFIVLHVILS